MDDRKVRPVSDGPPSRPLEGPRYDPATRSSPFSVAPHTRRVTAVPGEIASAWRQATRTEGKTAAAARVAVAVKHVTYLLTTLLVVGAVDGLLTPYPDLSGGPILLLASMTVMFAAAAVGGMVNPQAREEIAELMRKSAFGYTLFPALLIAGLARSLDGLGVSADSDLFARTIHSAIPWLFIADVVFPALLFAKTIVGMRASTRNAMDVEEEVGIWTRQDGLQR